MVLNQPRNLPGECYALFPDGVKNMKMPLHEPRPWFIEWPSSCRKYERSRRARYKIEALPSSSQRMRLGRVRLRRLWNIGEQFLLAATAQNLKRLVRFLAQPPPKLQLDNC
jgi:hypothetical protein